MTHTPVQCVERKSENEELLECTVLGVGVVVG